MTHNNLNHAVIHELMNLGLRDKQGLTVGLQRVTVQAKLQGVLMETTIRQHYRNSGPDNIEVSYVFPLAHGAMLAGMAVELNGKRLSGQVMPKQKALAGYEKAVASGDTPVMLREKSHGLYSADLGNLLPGDQAVIELRLLQTVVVSQGRARLVFPTAIAPRYGDERQGGLDLHETTRNNLMAEYGLSAEIDIPDDSASLSIKSPSHAIGLERLAGVTRVRLDKSAWLDRDWVLLLDGLDVRPSLQTCHTHDLTLAMATFVTDAVHTPERPLRLKLLVDGSGSMSNVPIAQAKAALHDLGSHLAEGDVLSLSLFGSHVEHPITRMEPVDARFLRLSYAPAVDKIEANLGGTEMLLALTETIALTDPAQEEPMDILLITDGAIWEIDDMLAAAKASGHRVFCLGVGAAPAEGLLHELADQTGGSCNFVTPNEAMGPAVADLVQRMRQGQSANVELNWGAPMEWSSPLPALLLPGETISVFGMAQGQENPKPTLTCQWLDNQAQEHTTSADFNSEVISPDWARLVVHQRIQAEPEHEQAPTWAEEFQLISPHTHYLLVHERAASDKAVDLPRLVQVEHMQTETVMLNHFQFARSERIDYSQLKGPAVWRSPVRRIERTNASETPLTGSMDDFELPAFLRKQGATPDAVHATAKSATPINDKAWNTTTAKPAPTKPKMTLARSLLDLSETSFNGLLIVSFNQNALQSTKLRQALSKTLATHQVDFVSPILMVTIKLIKDPAVFWCLYMQWLSETKGVLPSLDRHAKRLITEHLSKVSVEHQELVIELLEHFSTEKE
ncbi:von Willebrand factor, type A [Burkholderiaceae bacterium]